MTTTDPAVQVSPLRPSGYAKGRAKREQILQAAITLFGESGYHGTSLREIAAAAGITHPGLLHHFRNKAAVLKAVLEYRDAVDGANLQEELDQGVDLLDAMTRLMERNSLRPAIVEVYSAVAAEATSPDHPAHEYFDERYATIVGQLTDHLEQRRDAGELRPGVDIPTTARTVVAIMDGIQVQWLQQRDLPRAERVDMAGVLRAYLDLIIET